MGKKNNNTITKYKIALRYGTYKLNQIKYKNMTLRYDITIKN